MRKLPFLGLLGLLVAGPVSAQATVDHWTIDSGPIFWYFENPCTPGDMLELEWYTKGVVNRVWNSQGSHYVRNVQYTGEAIGFETGLVFTLHNPAHTHRMRNYDDQYVYRHQDELILVGKGDNGVEQIIEWTYSVRALHILPDGTVIEDYVERGDPVCQKKM